MVPMIHAENSAKRYGGKAEDYIDIHELMDSTKATFPDNRHRTICHNSWFTTNIIPKIFGHMRVNSDNKKYSTKDVAEYHILEDFRMKFIPSVQDYLENMDMKSWMQNGLGTPPSAKKLYKEKEDILISNPEANVLPDINKEILLTDFNTTILDGNFGGITKKPITLEELGIKNIEPSFTPAPDFKTMVLDGSPKFDYDLEKLFTESDPSLPQAVDPIPNIQTDIRGTVID